jgi:serine-type D-Ala-D-Ala carboxypeptidase/endopeptidase (penicillin-binding protein 4)
VPVPASRSLATRAPALAALLGLSLLARPGVGQPDPPASASESPPPPPAKRGFDASGVDEAVQKLVDDVQKWGGAAGVQVVDLGTGAPIVSRNEHAAFNPASNAKLVTAATALTRLGPQHRYQTGLYGKIVSEAVSELVLRGEGDPSLATPDIWAMAHELRAAGVRRVAAIAVDQGAFDDHFVPPAFEQQPNEWAPFRAPIAPVSLNENTVLFTVRAAKEGADASYTVDPPGFVDVTAGVKTSRRGEAEKVTLSVEAKGARLAGHLAGSIPEGAPNLRVARRVDDPRLLAGYALRSVLKEVGIEVAGDVHLGGEKQKNLLVAHHSRPLGELLAALGKDSDNFYAEMIFKSLGAEKAHPSSSDAAAEIVTAHLKRIGAFEPGVLVKNGSGLFDADRITPSAMTSLLAATIRDPSIAPEYVAQLAIGGVDGTLHGRFRAWSKERAIRAKTGTLESVAALSGYVLPPSGGSPVAFTILVNGIPGKVNAARASMDRVVEAIAKETYREK